MNVKHEQLETRLYLAAQQRDNPTFDAALDFNCDFMDEPNLQLQKYLSHDRSAINYAQQTDRMLDDLYDKQSGELDKKKRYARPARVREARAGPGLHHPDHLVAPHHRHHKAAEGLAHHAQPLRGAGPGGRLAGPVTVTVTRDGER